MVLDRELRPMRCGAQSDPQGYAGRSLLEHPQPNSAVTPLINPQGAIHIERASFAGVVVLPVIIAWLGSGLIPRHETGEARPPPCGRLAEAR